MNKAKQKILQKRIAIALLFIIVFFIIFQAIPDPVSIGTDEVVEKEYYTSSVDEKKIISLVYDDSASMSDAGNKDWAYADYAFQIFTSLLNDNDDLYVTYMSKASMSTLLASPNIDRQSSVDSVYNHFDNKSTPVGAVTTAFNRLDNMSIEDNSTATEYWLVIITDGYLQEAGSTNLLSSEYINHMVQEYSDTTLKNGAQLNVVYMGIGDEVAIVEGNDHAIVKYAKTGSEIVERMNEIANEIEKWDDPEKLDISSKLVGENKIQIKTDYPLEEIVILNQQSTASVKSFKRLNEEESSTELSVSKSYDIKYPEYPGCSTDKNLNANTVFLRGSESYMDSGTYEVTFDADISDSVKIFYVVASELRLYVQDSPKASYIQGGQAIDDTTKYVMHTKNFLTGTDIPFVEYMGVNPSLQKDEIYVTQVNEVVNSAVTNELPEYTYLDGVIQTNAYTSVCNVERKITVPMPVDHIGVYSSKISGTKDSASRTELIDRSLNMEIRVYHDEVQYTKRELEEMHLVVTSAQNYVDVQMNITDDGTVVISPCFGRSEWWFKALAGWIPSWIIKPGNYQVVLSFFDETEKVTFCCNEAYTITEEPLWLNVFYHLLPFLVILILSGYTRKAKFSKEMMINYIPIIIKNDLYEGDKRDWISWDVKPKLFDVIPLFPSLGEMLPFVADRVKNEHIKVLACDEENRTIKITTRHGYRITKIIVREDTISRRRDVQIHLNSDRLLVVDSDMIKTDESIGFILENIKTKDYFLYLVTFNRKRKDKDRRNF